MFEPAINNCLSNDKVYATISIDSGLLAHVSHVIIIT